MPVLPALLPFAGKALAGLGATTLGTGAVSRGISSNDQLMEWLGQTEEQQAQGELFDRTKKEGKRISRGPIESAFDFFMGRDRNVMERKALEQDNKRILKNITQAGYDLEDITSSLDSLNLSPKLKPVLDDSQDYNSFRQEIERARKAITAAENLKALHPDVDITGKNYQQLNTAFAVAEQKDRKKKENRGIKKENDAMAIALMQNNIAMQQANNQMEMQRMQNAYNNRRLDLQEARNDRRDRQLAIMKIMEGFANMGKSVIA